MRAARRRRAAARPLSCRNCSRPHPAVPTPVCRKTIRVTAPGGTEIRVQLGGASVATRATADGQWNATLPAMAAGGPYTLQVDGGGQRQQIQDLLVGDVFLCTGQSNMQLSVRRAANAESE